MRRFIVPLLAATALAFTSSCATNPIAGLLVTKGAKEKEVAALRADYEAKLAATRAEAEATTKRIISAKDGQIAGAGGGLWAADSAFRAILAPTRTDLIINNRVNEAWTSLGKPMPTADEMQKEQKRLKEELDEKATSLAQLQKNHTDALAQNQALADATKRHEAALVASEQKRLALEGEFRVKLDAKQTELIAVQSTLISAEKQRADDRAALQALKTKMSVVLGIVALAAVAGAIYLPVFKQQCALFGALCGLAAIGLWLIQPWHVALGAGVGVLALIGWMVAKHRKEERVSDALVLANQDIKEKAPEAWKSLVSPAITDRLSRYRKTKSGKLVTEKDPAMERFIDEKLASYDSLPGTSTPTS